MQPRGGRAAPDPPAGRGGSGLKPDVLAAQILEAYPVGVFPMADPRGRIGWYSPDPRAIIELDALHVPRSLRKTIKRGLYEIRIDTAFRHVMEGCARRDSTWISKTIVDAYCLLHAQGVAHSVEAWRGGQLCGGLYGLAIGAAFFGESMYAEAPDASKVCLVALVERLRERGYALLDCQWTTPHTERFGAHVIPRSAYLQRLAQAVGLPRRFDP